MRNNLHCFFRRNIILRVICPQVTGDGGRIFGFVIRFIVEANRECLHRPLALLLHQRNGCRGIHAAGKKSPERHVGDHAHLDCVTQQRIKTRDGLFFGTLVLLPTNRNAARVYSAYSRV